MDKIKELILERVQHTQILKLKCDHSLEYQELYQAKKAEKLRQIKENELIEALFNFGQASKCERQLFEVHSCEVMTAINYQFNYKPKNRGMFSDIAEMYIMFFDSIKLEARVEEIRIIAKYNLYQNFPFLCMLFKWLIEISRKIFVDIMAQAKTHATSEKSKKVQGNTMSMRNGNNLQSSQEHLKSINSKNQSNLTATTASQNTQESFIENGNENNSKYIKLNPIQIEGDFSNQSKKNSNWEGMVSKRKGKLLHKGVTTQQQSTRQNKENTSEGSKQCNTNNTNANSNQGITSRNQKDSQQQQPQEINRYQQHNSLNEKYSNTQPNQSEFSPKLSAAHIQNSSIINNKRRSLRISNSYTHKHSMDDNDIQSHVKEIQVMSSTQNFEGVNLSELIHDEDEEEEEHDIDEEEDTQMMMIRQTQSQIIKCSSIGGKSSNNLTTQQNDSDTQPTSSNMIGGGIINKNYIKEQSQLKQRMGNEFLKYQAKPNAEKLKRRKREMVFNNVKDCINDVEFVVQKCNDYLINFYLKLILQRNMQVKYSIDEYRVKYMQNLRNTFAKLDPGLIYTEQDKINVDQQFKNSFDNNNPLSLSTNNIDQFQKSSSQLIQNRSESSQANTSNNLSSNNNTSSQSQNRRTCTTLSPIHRPIGSERKSQRIMIETSKSNNFSSLNQNMQTNNPIINEKERKRLRALSQIANYQGQSQQQPQQQQQQEKSLSPLSQNIPFNQQFSKEFVQQNSVQLQQYQFQPQQLQRNSPEVRRQNIKNNKYNNCIIPSVRNFDTSEIEQNTFNANHIINSKHSNILKGKQSKFQKNLMMIKMEKNSSQPSANQFQQFNLDSIIKKVGGDEGKYINLIQNNTFYNQNQNLLRKIHSNDLSLSNIILGTANKNIQNGANSSNQNNNTSLVDENSHQMTQNHNNGGGSSCIILQAMNNTTTNGQDTFSKSATKQQNNYSSYQDSLVFEDEFARVPPSYHLNRGKYRPPKNPKILLQKIQNNLEDQIGVSNLNPQINQQRNLSGGKQSTFYNSLQQNGIGGPVISSFQNDLSFDIQMKQYTQIKKSQQHNAGPDNISGITALKNRKVLTQPDEILNMTPNEKLSTQQHYQQRSASQKGNKDEVIQKLILNKFNGLNNQIFTNNEITKQVGSFSAINGNGNNYNHKVNNNNSFSTNNNDLPFKGVYPFNSQNTDNSIFPFLKDAVAQQQENLAKYF